MTERLLVGVLGHGNAGKSQTWYKLFNTEVKTGRNERELQVSKDEKVSVFLINGSPAERGKDVFDIINPSSNTSFESPRIVLCSMQYPCDVTGKTLKYFMEHEYHIYIHWLNPGYYDIHKYTDKLGCIQSILEANNSLIGIRDGKTEPTSRVNEIREFVRGWASVRGLLTAG